jgi:hypothetical protein
MFVIAAGVPALIAEKLLTIVLTVVSISVVVHGMSPVRHGTGCAPRRKK